jgi:hypothetical protein
MKEIKVFVNNLDDVFKRKLTDIIHNFDTYEGGTGERNTIKIIKEKDFNLNIKAFKKPNFINKIVYKYFRKSKAQRSFEYANKLLEMGVGTPKPIAYFENTNFFLFNRSFYVSEHLEYDLTYRELITDFNYPDHEIILRAFTRFTFQLHENGINFLDHSPGNTLVKKVGKEYEFYLVDLNRMNFGFMDFETRVKNFAKLATAKSMIEIMSDEYAKCTGEDYNSIFNLMWASTQKFQDKYYKKIRFKQTMKFWKRKSKL